MAGEHTFGGENAGEPLAAGVAPEAVEETEVEEEEEVTSEEDEDDEDLGQ